MEHERLRLRHILTIAGLAVVSVATLYALLAYYALPRLWTQYDAGSGGALRPMVTVTVQGRPGDPINIGVVASDASLDAVMARAGWTRADPVTIVSSLRIAASVLFDRSYRSAPVSPLLYEGQPEDLAFEKQTGRSADRRQHVRFWQAASADEGSLWLGSVTFDAGVGFSHYTGAVTHDIAPDIDTARDALVADLVSTGLTQDVRTETGVGPTEHGRNGEGTRYRTDGMARIVTLQRD